MVGDIYSIQKIDYPTNIYAVSQADFGDFSLLFIPGLMLFLILSTIYMSILFYRLPFMKYFTCVYLVYHLMRVEQSYQAFMEFYRNLSVVFIIYIAIIITKKVKQQLSA